MMTAAPTAGSLSIESKASSSSEQSCRLKALRRVGSSKVTTATPSVISVRMSDMDDSTSMGSCLPGEQVRCLAVRILVLAEQYPWPAVDGYRQRLEHMIAGLARVGGVELVTIDRRPEGGGDDDVLPRTVVDASAVSAGAPSGVREWFPTWVRGDMPRRVLVPDWTGVSVELRRRLGTGPPADLIWYSHVDTWFPLHRVVDEVARERGVAPPAAIVDFDNLEHLALRLRRGTPPRFAPGAGAAAGVRTASRWAVSRAFDLIDERRWDRLQRECAAKVDHVVVCSEIDVRRSGCPNAVHLPNGSTAPDHFASDRSPTERSGLRGPAPTMLFVGALDYEPNTEAVEWFVRDVFGDVRRLVPDARVRIVGRGSDRVSWVADLPGVELVGPVSDLSVELDAADVSIVPIRVGAGTRLKVVEALANRIPLVSTTVGCEGIDLTDGVDALIRDDARGFAEACADLLTDGHRRLELAEAGAALFEDRYEWSGIEAAVASLAEDSVTGAQMRSRTTAEE